MGICWNLLMTEIHVHHLVSRAEEPFCNRGPDPPIKSSAGDINISEAI